MTSAHRESIDRHVQACEACIETLDSLGAGEDTVIKSLKTSVEDDEYEREPAVDDLLRRIEQIDIALPGSPASGAASDGKDLGAIPDADGWPLRRV